MTTDPAAIRARFAAVIRALLAKTTANGCSEDEAMAAASKARELMDKHHIAQGDLGMREEGTAQTNRSDTKYRSMNLSDRISGAVANYCDCRAWRDRSRSGNRLTFFGLRSDTEFATWLQDSLEGFVRQAAREFMAARWQDRHDARARWQAEKAFVIGCCRRINERLHADARARKAAMAAAPTGTSLVVVKDAIVEAGFRALGIQLRTARRSTTSINDSGAYNAGKAAGERASFGRPLGNSALRRIG